MKANFVAVTVSYNGQRITFSHQRKGHDYLEFARSIFDHDYPEVATRTNRIPDNLRFENCDVDITPAAFTNSGFVHSRKNTLIQKGS